MFQLAYGYQLRDKHDPIFKEAVLAIDNMIEAGMYTSQWFLFHSLNFR